MSKGDFTDGICDSCGNVGLAGEHCINCGGVFSKIDQDLSDPLLNQDDSAKPGEPQEYPDEISLESLDENSPDLVNEDENI